MWSFRKCTRILILCLLCVSIFVPIFLLSYRLKHINSDGSKQYVEDLSIIKHRTEAQTLSAIEKEDSEGLKEPTLMVYKDDDPNLAVSLESDEDSRSDEVKVIADDADLSRSSSATKDNQEEKHDDKLPASGVKEENVIDVVQHDQDVRTMPRKVVDEKVKEMKDQVIRAKAYINFSPANSSSHFVKELKIRIKEVERAMSQTTKDSRMSRSSLQKMKAMELTLQKASRMYPDCTAMVKKLRAMTYNAEEQVRTQSIQESFLKELGGRTIPKGLHCLSMRLTSGYFALEPEQRVFNNQHKLHDPHLYHFAVFSDNILACSVVVNSTVSAARDPERVVLHVITDSLNLPAMSMWFLLNPPDKATIHVESIDSFKWLATKYNVTFEKEGSADPRYTSELNHLRFYLPELFPHLNKILLLDHDVVVQRDLTSLFSIDMRGKVNGAVQTCEQGEPSFRRMDTYINFTDPIVTDNFEANSCTWAFGMNVFDLQEWRKLDLTGVYHKYLLLGKTSPFIKAGSLPMGWLTFYDHVFAIDKQWHLLGLGHDSNVKLGDIEEAAVIHYDGILKPWLDIGIDKYKHLWSKYVDYEHQYLQQCNIHG